MADLNSDSSGSSGENSGNSNTSDKSKASRNSRTSWTQNWTSKTKTGQDGRVLGAGNAYYDHLVDRQSATRAVAIVVHTASKRGYVPLCTEFASLLRDNKRMELEINRLKFVINQMKKKGICCYANHSKQSYSSSTSESGSGGSEGLKSKKEQTKAISTTGTQSSINEQNSMTSTSIDAPSERNNQNQTAQENQLTVEEQLKKAKEQIFKLENQLSFLKAENQALRSQVKHSLQMPSTNPIHEKVKIRTSKSTKENRQNSPETLPASSLHTKETLNIKTDNLIQGDHDQNCYFKSCVKHRTKNGSRTLTPHKTHTRISPDQAPSFDENTTSCNLMPIQLQKVNQTHDKKPLEIKPKVLPKLGDYVTVQGEIKGYVNYVGPVKGETSDFVGIQLPAPVGNNDGSIDGVKLFSCPPNYGAFVPLQDIQTVDPRPPPMPP